MRSSWEVQQSPQQSLSQQYEVAMLGQVAGRLAHATRRTRTKGPPPAEWFPRSLGSMSLSHHGGRDQLLLCLTRTKARTQQLHEVELYERRGEGEIKGEGESVAATQGGGKRRRLRTGVTSTAFQLVATESLPPPLEQTHTAADTDTALSVPLENCLDACCWTDVKGRVVHSFCAGPGRLVHSKLALPTGLSILPKTYCGTLLLEDGTDVAFFNNCDKQAPAANAKKGEAACEAKTDEAETSEAHMCSVVLIEKEAKYAVRSLFHGSFDNLDMFSHPLCPGLLFMLDWYKHFKLQHLRTHTHTRAQSKLHTHTHTHAQGSRQLAARIHAGRGLRVGVLPQR